MLCRSGRRGFDEAFCYGAYEGTLRKLIHLFKYSGMRRLAQPLGALLGDALPVSYTHLDVYKRQIEYGVK